MQMSVQLPMADGASGVRYQDEISNMMYVFGEVRNPREDVTRLVEEIVRNHTRDLAAKAGAVVRMRGGKAVAVDDFVFLVRHDRGKVNRLKDYLGWKDVRKRAKSTEDHEDIDMDDDDTEAAPPTKKRIRFTWEYAKEFHDHLEDDSNDEDEEDIEAYRDTMLRLKQADDITKSMSREEYMGYANAKQASFTHRKGKKFRDWSLMGDYLDTKPSDDVIDVVGFLCYEMIRALTETALEIKRSTSGRADAVTAKPDLAASPAVGGGTVVAPAPGSAPAENGSSQSSVSVARADSLRRTSNSGRSSTADEPLSTQHVATAVAVGLIRMDAPIVGHLLFQPPPQAKMHGASHSTMHLSPANMGGNRNAANAGARPRGLATKRGSTAGLDMDGGANAAAAPKGASPAPTPAAASRKRKRKADLVATSTTAGDDDADARATTKPAGKGRSRKSAATAASIAATAAAVAAESAKAKSLNQVALASSEHSHLDAEESNDSDFHQGHLAYKPHSMLASSALHYTPLSHVEIPPVPLLAGVPPASLFSDAYIDIATREARAREAPPPAPPRHDMDGDGDGDDDDGAMDADDHLIHKLDPSHSSSEQQHHKSATSTSTTPRTPLQVVHIQEAYRQLMTPHTFTRLYRGGTLAARSRNL